eukprot:4597482-Karenia_brevis.AAC.1
MQSTLRHPALRGNPIGETVIRHVVPPSQVTQGALAHALSHRRFGLVLRQALQHGCGVDPVNL